MQMSLKKSRHYNFNQSDSQRAETMSNPPTLPKKNHTVATLDAAHKYVTNSVLHSHATTEQQAHFKTAQMTSQESLYCIAKGAILHCQRACIAIRLGLNKKIQGHILQRNMCPCVKYYYSGVLVSTTIGDNHPSRKALLSSALKRAKAGEWPSDERVFTRRCRSQDPA